MTLDNPTGPDVWTSASWHEAAVLWLDEQLAAAGIERTGEVEQPHLRAWGTVLRAPTSSGPVWMKAVGPSAAFEVGLYELLTRVTPDHVLTPIATDLARGWIVLPDGGPSVGERVAPSGLVDALATALPEYGRLQRTVAPHADALLGLGIADMRAEAMPGRFEQALEAVGGYVDRHGTAADRATYAKLPGMSSTFASWCERLAAMPAPASLDHNDLHPWNILSGARFYDWGDSVVAHPFASMLVPLGMVQRQLGAGLDAPELVRVRDAYLGVFGDLAPHAELVDALELACRVGKVARALTWERALRALDGDDDGTFARAPLHCMVSLLDASYLGGA